MKFNMKYLVFLLPLLLALAATPTYAATQCPLASISPLVGLRRTIHHIRDIMPAGREDLGRKARI